MEYCFQKELTILGAQQLMELRRRGKMKWGSNAKGILSVKQCNKLQDFTSRYTENWPRKTNLFSKTGMFYKNSVIKCLSHTR